MFTISNGLMFVIRTFFINSRELEKAENSFGREANGRVGNINCHILLTRASIKIVRKLQIIHRLIAKHKRGGNRERERRDTNDTEIYGIVELSENRRLPPK